MKFKKMLLSIPIFISVIIVTVFITLEINRGNTNIKQLDRLLKQNQIIKQQLDSILNEVSLKDKLLVGEIDSMYVVLQTLDEKRSYNKNGIQTVKGKLYVEQERRKAILESLNEGKL